MPTMPPYYGQMPWEYEMVKWIDRTKAGLLILLIGVIVGVIPIIGIFGLIIAIVGTILVILGRRAFGDKHSTYVLLSVGIFIFGYIVVIFTALIFAFSIAPAARTATSQSALVQIVTSALNSLIIGIIIGGAITSFSYVLLTYAIQTKIGRILLWAAYGISLVIYAAIFITVTPQISSALNATIATGTFDPSPINALRAQISNLGILNLIPYGLYALAYYLVFSRVNRGEIPARASTQPQISPSMPPHTPPAL